MASYYARGCSTQILRVGDRPRNPGGAPARCDSSVPGQYGISGGVKGMSWEGHANVMRNVMEMSCECHGNVMGRSCECHGNVMVIYGNIMGISREYHGNVMEMAW